MAAEESEPMSEPTIDERTTPPRVLMIHPLFMGGSFWSFDATSKMYGAEYTMPPLGLVTLAAMLPQDWDIRLIDRNVEDLSDEDILAADLVMAGGMLPQRPDLVNIIEWTHRLGRKIAVGGPDVMSSPQCFEQADFMVIGEAEGVIDEFVAAWRAGAARGRFEPPRFKADVTASPLPRFDLLKRDKYTQMTVQFSRGCPFTCEFCDIIELYGRRPRTKTTEQVLAELKYLKDLGHRGHIMFVDDNLIGNKKAVKQFLPELIRWQQENGRPFDFSTEASINLADDEELMRMLAQAGFIGVFIGIESPDEDVLTATKKKQNTKRNIVESIHKIYGYGLGIMGGFIVGFDEEKGPVGDAISELVEDSAIPVAMVGLLYALPETELARRLEREGRLHPLPSTAEEALAMGGADQCTQGLNFDTLRPRAEILRDYRVVLERIYEMNAYHRRLRRLADLLRFEHAEIDLFRSGFMKNAMVFGRLSWTMGVRARRGKRLYWGTILHAVRRDPRTLESILVALAAYLHVGPFSEHVIRVIDERIARESDEPAPALVAAE